MAIHISLFQLVNEPSGISSMIVIRAEIHVLYIYIWLKLWYHVIDVDDHADGYNALTKEDSVPTDKHPE